MGPVTTPIYLVNAKAEFALSAEIGETLFFTGCHMTLSQLKAQAANLDMQEQQDSDEE